MLSKILLSFILFLSLAVQCQDVLPSNTYVRTCLNDIECSSINSSSYLFYDREKGKFYIMIDFNRLKTGIDSVDFWLEDLNDTYYYFKAPMQYELFPGVSNYNQKTFKLSGQAFLNNIWKAQTIEVTLIRADNDMMSNSIDSEKIEALRVNLNFTIVPKDFNVHKKPQRLTNTIFVGIGSGRLNPLKREQISMLGDAYNQGD
jgi:hypothetical protein